MEFGLSEESRMLKRTVREFAEKEIAPLVEEAERKEITPVHLYRRLGELGWLCMSYPKEYGAAGSDKLAECITIEEVGRVCAGIATIIHSQLAATLPILHFGTNQQKTKYLTPAIKGEKISGFFLSEPNAGSDAAGIETIVRKEGYLYILNGRKMFATNASIADFAVVAAYTDKKQRAKGIALFIVDKGTPGFIVTKKLEKLGNRSSETCEVLFEDCQVPNENLIGEETGGFLKVTRTLYGARITHAARSIGVAQAAYDAAWSYAQERNQFGQPISKFQAIRHKLARMAIDLEAARLLVYKASWLYDTGQEYIKEASMAKVLASEVGIKVTTEAMQIHGGYGYTLEYPVQRYFRDARCFTITEGTTEINLGIIARELGL